MPDETIEQQIQEKGLNAPRITPQRIESLLNATEFRVSHEAGTTSTFVHAFLDGQFYLASGHSACVSPENFDSRTGKEIAQWSAEQQVTDKLYELEGYCLYRELLEKKESP